MVEIAQSPARGWSARLIAFLGVTPDNLGPALVTISITSFLSLIACVAYPAIIFSGDLAPYLPAGIGVGLLSAAILGLVMAATSAYPGTMAYAQSEPAVILGLIAASIATTLHAEGRDAEILPTILTSAAIGSLLYGGFLLFLGYFRLGNLIRYIPFPVMGGFLAGIGWLLFKAALSTMAGFTVGADTLAALAMPDSMMKWAPGVVLGGLLWLLQKYRPRAVNFPALLGLSGVGFWLGAAMLGFSAADLRGGGWLLGPFPDSGIWSPLQHIEAMRNTAWDVLPDRWAEFATLALMTAVALLLNANAIEINTRRDLDLNGELKRAGFANLLGGGMGALPGYYALNASTLAYRLGTPIRLVGVATALVCLLALLVGTQFLAYVPRFISSALIVYMALGFLVDWLYTGWRRMGRGDFAVLVLVFAVVVLAGFMQGIALGTVAGAALFVVRCSKIGVTRNVLSGANYHSNVDRAENQRAALREEGDEIFILRLQGFVFFGTANALTVLVRERLNAGGVAPLRYLMFDFRLVTGMDYSAAAGFTKIAQYADEKGFTLGLCQLTDELTQLLRKEGLDARARRCVRLFPDLDHGLEWAENDLLGSRDLALPGDGASFSAKVRTICSQPDDAERFQSYFETVSYEAGETLIRQGTASDDMFFIDSGQVAIMLNLPNGGSVRLKSMGAGTAIGEIAFYLGVPRSASVVALEKTAAYRLSSEQLRAMHRDVPALAIVFHEHMARTLAARLVETNQLVGALNA